MGTGKGPFTPGPRVSGLSAKLQDRTARVGVIGLGYVGLPLGLLCATPGSQTTGFDIDPGKIEKLRRGESYIHHISAASIAEEVEKKRFQATDDFTRLKEMDAIIICVPTPLDKHREPDLSFVLNTAKAGERAFAARPIDRAGEYDLSGNHRRRHASHSGEGGLKCPVSPYTTDGVTVTASEGAEPDFFLAFSPEREDPGNKQFQTRQVPKIVGGVNASSALAAQALYQSIFERTHWSVHPGPRR